MVVSACLLFFSPGLLLSLALDAARSVARWVLSGFALSLLVVSAMAGIVQATLGVSLRGAEFAAAVVACGAGCLGLLLIRTGRTGRVS